MPLSRLKAIPTLAAIGLATLCGCQPAAVVKVAFIGGLSGRVSELAIDGRNGTQLAIETLNAQDGPRFELHVHDSPGAGTPAAIVDDRGRAEGLRRKTDGRSLCDALRASTNWPGLQRPIVRDHFGDSVSRFRLGEVRKGHFVMLGS